MKQLIENTYIMKNHSIKHLKLLGFYPNKNTYNSERKCYSIRFPVVKYNEHASIEGEFIVDTNDGKVIVNVYDLKGNYYTPFYNHEYGNFDDIISIINKNIKKQMIHFKIEKRRFIKNNIWMKK